jgi:hypothetical protein
MGKKFRRGWGKLFAALELQKFRACRHATIEKRRGVGAFFSNVFAGAQVIS